VVTVASSNRRKQLQADRFHGSDRYWGTSREGERSSSTMEDTCWSHQLTGNSCQVGLWLKPYAVVLPHLSEDMVTNTPVMGGAGSGCGCTFSISGRARPSSSHSSFDSRASRLRVSSIWSGSPSFSRSGPRSDHSVPRSTQMRENIWFTKCQKAPSLRRSTSSSPGSTSSGELALKG